jgi:hypothetical protein
MFMFNWTIDDHGWRSDQQLTINRIVGQLTDNIIVHRPNVGQLSWPSTILTLRPPHSLTAKNEERCSGLALYVEDGQAHAFPLSLCHQSDHAKHIMLGHQLITI